MCKLYSTECGADAWLQFDETDSEKLQELNGKCVVVVGHRGNRYELDEYDPRAKKNPYKLLWVDKSKLRNEDGNY